MQRPLPEKVQAMFGAVDCPDGCGRFALWPKQNFVPPHARRALMGLPDGSMALVDTICPRSGAIFPMRAF